MLINEIVGIKRDKVRFNISKELISKRDIA